MTGQLRVGLEKIRKYYTEKLVEKGVIQEEELLRNRYTLAELESMYKVTFQVNKVEN
ncbi:hypothetical protein ACLM5H_22205 [Fredinandcohnia humi]